MSIHYTTAWGILFALCITAALVLRVRRDGWQALQTERTVWYGASFALVLYEFLVAIVAI